MDKQKVKQPRKNIPRKPRTTKVSEVHRRPLHIHIALHPVSLLLILCVGVLLVIYTFRAFATSTTINAVVPAPALTDPAVITSPTDNTQFTTQTVTVTGTCPNNSYVQLLDNSILAGVATCSSNIFSISLDLTTGSNELQAQDYNITNQAGPASPPVTVTYTPPATPPTPTTSSTVTTPTQLLVTQADYGVPFTSVKDTPTVSANPRLAGIAPPYSRIRIAVRPNSYTCTTTADSQGYWSCLVSQALEPAIHTVVITAFTPSGQTLAFPAFTVRVVARVQPPVVANIPFRITTNYSYKVYTIGDTTAYLIHIVGGHAPYAFTIAWGDNDIQTLLRQTSDDFTISHKYNWINAVSATRTVKIEAVDTDGQASTLQLQTALRNPAFHTTITGNTNNPTTLNRILGSISPRLWLLWPGYMIVLLMVFSFWLGERQELAALVAAGQHKPRRPHHAHVRH